jgi:hypothetical protein
MRGGHPPDIAAPMSNARLSASFSERRRNCRLSRPTDSGQYCRSACGRSQHPAQPPQKLVPPPHNRRQLAGRDSYR